MDHTARPSAVEFVRRFSAPKPHAAGHGFEILPGIHPASTHLRLPGPLRCEEAFPHTCAKVRQIGTNAEAPSRLACRPELLASNRAKTSIPLRRSSHDLASRSD